MEKVSQTSNHMGTARISGLVLKMGIPLMISLMINSLYNFVDSIFVSRISEDALTVLSLSAPVQLLMSAMGLGIAVGLNAVASITNLILDPVLIFGYLGFPAMGTAGAALATVTGQWVGCFAGYFINCHWNREIPIHFTAKIDKGCIAAILKVGIPSTLVQAISSVLAIYVNSVLMAITPTAVAVYGVCVKIQGLVTVGVNGMGSGLIPIVAYNYGAKEPKRIYQSCHWAMFYSILFYSVFFLVMEVFPEWVLLLFDASEEMLVIGAAAIRIMAVSYLLSNICLTYSAAFQGLGMGIQSMLLTLARQVVLPVIFVAMLSHTRNLPLIWMAFVFAEAVVIPVGTFLWRKESGKVLNKSSSFKK